ncbi:MAG: N-acetyltransferase [Rhizobiales bacterium]|nr:N-acetyltransferase [Hyphomicrobiales bacterium]
MEFFCEHIGREQEITDLFIETFTNSEGPDEGKIIGQLVNDLMETTAKQNLFVFSTYDNQSLISCIFFSRLNYEEDPRTVFILSPVAVKPNRQRMGVGQKLITFGLNELRQKGIDIVFTYGDPTFYSKVGFKQITEEFALAPHKLDQPHGWLSHSLSRQYMEPLVGPSRCVEALNKPELW